MPNSILRFAQALTDPKETCDVHLVDDRLSDIPERISIYRNNIESAYINVLQQGYPVLEKLLGADYFMALARLYSKNNPPTSPILYEYGDDLAGFIEQFPPLSDKPYLTDIAKLERFRLLAFHAKDAKPKELSDEPKALNELLSQQVRLHPSVNLISSSFPLYTLWESQVKEKSTSEIAHWEPEHVLVWRLGLEIRTERVNNSMANILLSVQRNMSLNQAFEPYWKDPKLVGTCLAMILKWELLTILPS